MAQVFIRGRNIPIDVESKEALAIKKALDSNEEQGQILSLANMSIRLSEVKSVVLGSDATAKDIDYSEITKKYYEERKEYLAMPPKERANVWRNHYSIFHWAIFQNAKPVDDKQIDEYWELVKPFVVKFFEENPKWSKPSIKVYRDALYKLGKISKGIDMNGMAFDVLKRCEWRELDDIEGDDKYLKSFDEKRDVRKKEVFEPFKEIASLDF